jgi:hypothetical protein
MAKRIHRQAGAKEGKGNEVVASSAELVERLLRLAKMRTLEERQQFLETMIEVSKRADPAVVDDLLRVIDDESEERGLMTELYRALEATYPPAVFVPALLRNVEPMLEKAAESTFYLHARVLNDDRTDSYELYAAGLPELQKEARASLRKMFETEFEAQHPERLRAVRSALAD